MPVRVKICGLTTDDAVDAAALGGAAMTGFVFFPPSPRSLEPEEAARLVGRVPEGVLKVGVMVDPDDDLMQRILDLVPLDMLQLHGHETPARVSEIRARTGCMVMKALRIETTADLASIDDYVGVSDFLLFDAKPPEDARFPGGHGRVFDWRVLNGVRASCPWLLAGGVDEANLEAAVRLAGASMVDVSSGVEVRPGQKDVQKIKSLLERASVLSPAVQPVEVPA